jgi:hypothetical protein
MVFQKVGKCEPLLAGETGERVWLILKNNTRWSILVRTFGVPDEYGEAGLFYDVEASGSVPDGPLPHGYWWDLASLSDIGSGESLTFSVPRNHLDPGLAIKVNFQFDWEGYDDHIRHFSYFSYWDLPDALRDKQKEKKLRWPSFRGAVRLLPAVPQLDEPPEPPALVLSPTMPELPKILQPAPPKKN